MTRGATVAAIVAVTVLTTTWGCAEQVPPQVAPSRADTSGPAPEGGTQPSVTPVAPARRAPSATAAEAPRRVVLPSGRSVPVAAVGTTTGGVLDVPDDIGVAGWWRGGSRLGDPFGSVLVAAHVDSATQGLGPFAELLGVTAGSRIHVQSRSLRRTYEVRSRRLVPQRDLADDAWIFDVTGEARLTLVTCAPPYDAARGGYQNLAVVTALPVGTP
jgi:hypothetical protein